MIEMAAMTERFSIPAFKPPRNGGRWLLSHNIARSIMAASAVIAIACGLLFAAVFYVTLDRQAAADLAAESERLAVLLDERASTQADLAAILEEQTLVSAPDTRITLIAEDGTVLFDDSADVAALDNHALRPEVIQAMETGEGESGRFSDTLQEETIYHAVRLEHGAVIRLATTQSSIWGVMLSMAVPCTVVIVFAVLVSAAVGWFIARRISANLSAMNLDSPLSNTEPEELVPLLMRLNDQRKRIDAQAAERRRFTANVSHELKTPLTVISGYAEIIEKGIAKPEDVTKFSGLIHLEAQHMRAMVDDLLVLSRLDDMEAPDMRVDMDNDVSLGKVARSVVARLEQAACMRSVDVRLSVPEDDGLSDIFVKGNQRMLDELVRNLVENAIRYNKPGGSVEVKVFRDQCGRPVLSVSDTGEGIPPELREKVFERFFCVDESRSKESGGSGLGLAIVKHAAQIHGASIIVRGNAPSGTVFEVTF